SDVDAEYVACPGASNGRVDGFCCWKKRGGPRIPRLGRPGLSVAPAHKCRTPLVAFVQSAVPKVCSHPLAVVVACGLLHTDLGGVASAQRDLRRSFTFQTVSNLEEGKTGGQTDKLSALIFFYGYTHK